jgi:trans-2,3-dihydro-3-hydroxyanthranilate isomerase
MIGEPADVGSAAVQVHRFETLDVFTDRRFHGNPLAVVLPERALAETEMLALTREFGYSETIFLASGERTRGAAGRASARWHARIFTPASELPYAGHPTVGAAHALRHLGLVEEHDELVLEELVGAVPVSFRRSDGAGPAGGGSSDPLLAFLAVPGRPEQGPPPTCAPEELASVVGLCAEDIAPGVPIRSVRAGSRMWVLPVRTPACVERAHLDRQQWERVLSGSWARALYVVCESGPHSLRVRFFNPGSGIDEDPATGAAAGALGFLLAEREAAGGDAELRWTVAQGAELGRPGTIQVRARVRDGRVEHVLVGGAARVVFEGTVRL